MAKKKTRTKKTRGVSSAFDRFKRFSDSTGGRIVMHLLIAAVILVADSLIAREDLSLFLFLVGIELIIGVIFGWAAALRHRQP